MGKVEKNQRKKEICLEKNYLNLLENLSNDTLEFLENIVCNLLEPNTLKCRKCNMQTNTKIILKQDLVIETVLLFSKIIADSNFDISIVLEKIP